MGKIKPRKKHEELRKLIKEMDRSNSKFWKSISKLLNKPRRKRFEVNVFKINKFCKENETVLVPGIVLGNGEINKKVNVVALKFSKNAKRKIEDAGGKTINIWDGFKKIKKIKDIRIIG